MATIGHSAGGFAQRTSDGTLLPLQLDDSNNLKVVSAGGTVAGVIADGSDTAEGTTTDAAWVSGAGTVIALLKKIASAGGSAVSIADGADVAEGLTTDAAVASDTAGTISGKLRGLVKILANVWDSINGRLNVSVLNTPTVVQGTPGGSTSAWPVTIYDSTGAFNMPSMSAPNKGGYVYLTDGSSTGTIKAASTLPLATDTAYVVTLRDAAAVTGTFWPATQPVSLATAPTTPVTNASLDGTLLATLDTDIKQISTDLKNNIATLPLPTGAATAARQDTSNTSLTTIATNTTVLATLSTVTDSANPVEGASTVGTVRLAIDTEASTRDFDGVSALYVGDRILRRFAEQGTLRDQLGFNQMIISSEWESSQRMGLEAGREMNGRWASELR